MDKALINSLEFNKILDLIQPAGENGKQMKYHLAAYKTGGENELVKQYQRLEHLIQSLKKDKKLKEQINSALSLAPLLNTTLKAVAERQLLLHECFELKKLFYYAIILKQSCEQAGLIKHYPFPNLDKVFAILDADHTQSPVFAISGAYSKKLAVCLGKMQDLQLKQRQIEHHLQTQAQEELALKHPISTVVVSRLETTKVKLYSKSKKFILVDENFANLTFKLKDNREITTLKKRVLMLKSRLNEAEEAVLISISKQLRSQVKSILKTAEIIKILDWDFAKAMFAIKHNAVIPTINRNSKVFIKQAICLPLQASMAEHKRKYQPLDLQFSHSVNVITGPNMGGKTTALKTLGQMVLLAQYAMPIPAQDANICLFDNIWFNHDEQATENLSSFGREIVSLAAILKKKGKSLLLLDELAKGTNPQEGEAILTALLQYLSNKPCLSVAATHFDKPAHIKKAVQFAIKGIDIKQLEQLEDIDRATLHARMDLFNNLMDYSMVKLSVKDTPPLNAIPIADILGLPEAIINEARKLLS